MAVRPRFQINVSAPVLNRAKAVAYNRGTSLTAFILQLLAKEDEELKALIEEDLASRSRPGNPTKPKS